MPDMTFVDSTNIEAIGYDSDSMELHIRFLNTGATYIYSNVPEAVFEELMSADSKGSYFNRNIKPTYKFEKS